MNRYKFTDEFMTKLKLDYQNKVKYNPFIRKYKPVFKKSGVVYVNDLPIIPQSEVADKLEEITENSESGLGIRSIQAYTRERFHGITRSMITDFLKSNPKYQRMEKRPDRSTDKKPKPEGKTAYHLKKHPNTLGIDLIITGEETYGNRYKGENDYLCVVVHQYSGYTFCKSMGDSKSSQNTTRVFKQILKEYNKLFPPCTNLIRDGGTEFGGKSDPKSKSAFQVFLRDQDIKDNEVKKVSFVESKNSQIQRYHVFLMDKYPFRPALALAVKKCNNTPNRTLGGKTPAELTGLTTAKMKQVKKIFRKYKGGNKAPKVFRPRTKKEPGHKVLILKKSFLKGTDAKYKSYQGNHWSREIHEVLSRREDKYKVTGVQYMLNHDEMKLYVKPVYKAKKKAIKKPQPKKPKPKKPKAPQPVRRSKRGQKVEHVQLAKTGKMRAKKNMFFYV